MGTQPESLSQNEETGNQDNPGGLAGRLKEHTAVMFGTIAVLVAAFEVPLILNIKRLPPLFPPEIAFSPVLSAFRYFLPLAGLLPALAGWSRWRILKRAEEGGEISASAAELCYSLIARMLFVTYLVLLIFANVLERPRM
jgi:hypothetical protein